MTKMAAELTGLLTVNLEIQHIISIVLEIFDRRLNSYNIWVAIHMCFTIIKSIRAMARQTVANYVYNFCTTFTIINKMRYKTLCVSFLVFSILSTMSSFTLTLSGNSSSLVARYFPPIELDRNANYLCCLVDFHTYNSIPNVTEVNNKFHIKRRCQIPAMTKTVQDVVNFLKTKIDFTKFDKTTPEEMGISLPEKHWEFDCEVNLSCTLPIGAYELDDIARFIEARVSSLHMTVDQPTAKCSIEIKDDRTKVDFNRKNSIGSVLGFDRRMLESSGKYIADRPINITNLNAIRIDCNIASGSFMNERQSHNIHEFYPEVAPGYKITEVPKNLIYLPVVGHSIHTLRINITDQNGNLIDFRGETVTCRIHIKKET